MNCHWRSTQRRTELLRFAANNGFDRIALGHHIDEILEAFLMNITRTGEISRARTMHSLHNVEMRYMARLTSERGNRNGRG